MAIDRNGGLYDLLSRASDGLPRRPENLPSHSQHQHTVRTQAGYPARGGVRIERAAGGGDDQRRVDRRRRQSAGLRGMAGRAGQAHHPVLRPLRRAAARSAGRVEVAAVRAGSARGQHLRARRGGRQGPGLYPDQGRGRPAQDHRQASGEREVSAGGRRGDRRRIHRGVRQEQASAPEGRRRGGVRHRNVRARAADHLHRAARVGVLRVDRAGRRPRPAFGNLRRRGAESDAWPSPRSSPRSKIATATSRFRASTTAWCRPARRSAKRGRGCRSTKRNTRRRRWARANWWASPGINAVRAHVGAAHAGGSRHPRRLHGRGREDRDPGARGGQDQHAPGGRPAPGRSRSSRPRPR